MCFRIAAIALHAQSTNRSRGTSWLERRGMIDHSTSPLRLTRNHARCVSLSSAQSRKDGRGFPTLRPHATRDSCWFLGSPHVTGMDRPAIWLWKSSWSLGKFCPARKSWYRGWAAQPQLGPCLLELGWLGFCRAGLEHSHQMWL
eukprot:jgi/Botrbrau1/17614/Bobra.0166s0050.1